MWKRQASARRDRDDVGAGRRSRSGSLRRRRSVELGRQPEAEVLEVRALLSGQTVPLIKDVNAVESYPSNLTPVGSNLFYTVEDSSNAGTELVVTNAQGTQLLHDFGTGSYGSLSQLTGVGGSLFFLSQSGGSRLWTSDGTTGGTAQVPLTGDTSPSIGALASVGNSLVFTTTDYTGSGVDDQLWAASPGSTAATMIEGFESSSVTVVGTVGSTAYLSVGGTLWTTGGTADTTVQVKDASNNAVPAPSDVFSYKGAVVYLSSTSASSTIGILGGGGETPAVTGLPASTSDPVVVGSSFYFTSSAGAWGPQTEFWVSDGTQNGTTLLKNFNTISTSSVPSNFVGVNGALFFTVAGNDGLAQLWTSSGTSQGTTLVKDLGVTGPDSGSYYGADTASDVLVPIGGTLYYDGK